MQDYHLTKGDDHWRLTKEGSNRAVVREETKVDATSAARDYVKSHGGGSVKIHLQRGPIQEERTYPRSADPPATRG